MRLRFVLSVVHHLGQHVNPQKQIESLLELLQESVGRLKRQKLLEKLEALKSQPLPERQPIRLKQGAIQETVIAVLSEAGGPLYIKDIHNLVEEFLHREVSYHTVCSFLTTAANQHKTSGIHRVGKGQYLLLPSYSR
jgi:hypothetical protein